MSEKSDRVDKRTLIAERTYRVSARMIENFPQLSFFVSPRAHRLYHLQLTLFPDHAGKKDISKMSNKELLALPKGFRVLDLAITMRYYRDLANFGRLNFSPPTHEELVAAKFEESKGFKKVMDSVIKDE